MSAFGMTYAVYVALVTSSMVALDAPVPPKDAPQAQQGTWSYSLGYNDPRKGTPGADGFVNIEYLPNGPALWRGLKPRYDLGVSVDGAVFGSAGLRKDFYVSNVLITPYTGLVAYQSDLGKSYKGRELIQFKTGIDVTVPLTPKVSLGVGYYHISNAGLTRSSAEIDVSRVLLQYRY
jgi:hypothetical protein